MNKFSVIILFLATTSSIFCPPNKTFNSRQMLIENPELFMDNIYNLFKEKNNPLSQFSKLYLETKKNKYTDKISRLNVKALDSHLTAYSKYCINFDYLNRDKFFSENSPKVVFEFYEYLFENVFQKTRTDLSSPEDTINKNRYNELVPFTTMYKEAKNRLSSSMAIDTSPND